MKFGDAPADTSFKAPVYTGKTFAPPSKVKFGQDVEDEDTPPKKKEQPAESKPMF